MRIGRDELSRPATAFAGFFCLLAGNSILRPVRDQVGVAQGVSNLPWMFAATLAAVLAAAPLFTLLTARIPRARCLPLAYRAFAAGLLAAWAGLHAHAAWAPAALFVWTGVCNLLSVSLFWALLTDVFGRPQASRLFGPIAAGGTAGTLAGPLLVEWLVRPLGAANLLLVCVALLELSVHAAGALRSPDRISPGPSLRAGLSAVLRSNFLLGVCGYVALLTWTGTLLYVEQARIVAHASADPRERTLLFARMDLAVSLITLALQGILAGRVRIRGALAALPVLSAAAFVALAIAPSLAVLAAAQGLRKAAHFGIERPAREVLFTSLDPEQKYSSKAFIDTAVYRSGDAIGAWFSQALSPGTLAPAALALCALWLVNSLPLAGRDPAGSGGVR